ncbi:MAG: GNVR domain-containing protein, partial [Candidatus Angelobacter sp.]
LKQLTGTTRADGRTDALSSDAGAYPSLRKLPLLAYKYTDLYRQTKIQESVYEFLNQQYEIARVQEAKELPTVRVMDPAITPERKSGPIRSLVVGLSMIVGLGLACFWIVGKNFWRQIPSDDPRRLLAAEVASVVRRKFRYRTALRLR